MVWRIIIWPILKKLNLMRAQLVGNQLLPFIKAGDSVLDFGCGLMYVSKYIASKKKISLTGVDTAQYKITDAYFVTYDGSRLPFKNNQFDVVLALFVLHHTDNPEFYLQELIRVSKRKIVICEDTYITKIGEAITKTICWVANILVGNTNLTRNFKSVKEWKELFEKNNLSIVTFKRFLPPPIPFLPMRNVIMEVRK